MSEVIKMKVPLSRAFVDDETKQKVLQILDSGFFILKDECKKFEEEFSKFMGMKYGVLANSQTSIAQLTLMALNVKPGDEIIVPSHTAFPTIEPICHVGAIPVFVDTDENFLIDVNKIEEKITSKTKGIIPVHLFGNAVNMDIINQIAKKHNIWVMEDCAQAHNAEFNGKKVGSFGIASCFSFYPSKNMTFCGDGGIMLTSDEKIAKTVQMLRDHGRFDKYSNTLVGFNMRCNEIQAGIGRIQLKHLDEFTDKRIKIAELYYKNLKNVPIKLPKVSKNGKHVYHMFVIETDKRDELQNFLKQNEIETGIQYPIPCHLQPAITNKYGTIKLPHTEETAKTILSLPMFPKLKEDEINYVCDKIKEFYNVR